MILFVFYIWYPTCTYYYHDICMYYYTIWKKEIKYNDNPTSKCSKRNCASISETGNKWTKIQRLKGSRIKVPYVGMWAESEVCDEFNVQFAKLLMKTASRTKTSRGRHFNYISHTLLTIKSIFGCSRVSVKGLCVFWPSDFCIASINYD